MTNRKVPFSPHEHLSDVRACAPRTGLCKIFLRLAARRRWEVNGARTLKPLPGGVKPESPVSSLER